MSGVLYISYDGLCDPLGRTQVLPYILGLAERGYHMAVMSFEKPEATWQDRAQIKSICEQAGVLWIPQTYHHKPTVPATALDITTGVLKALPRYFLGKLSLIHARSYISATIALPFKHLLGVPLLFDMRGFWPNEKVEAGHWQMGSKVYNAVKKLEKKLFNAADAVVSLTHSGRRELETWPQVGGRNIPVEVIPTCVDLERFFAQRRVPRSERPLTISYVGSMGGRYLIDETVEVFAKIRKRVPEAILDVYTPREQDPLWQGCERHGVPTEVVSAKKVPASEIAVALAKSDATISLIKPGFASLASCPTKFGESLAAGAPVIVNPGIGDCAEIVSEHKVGAVTEVEGANYQAIADELLELLEEGDSLVERCRDTSKKYLSLEGAIGKFDGVYRRLMAPEHCPAT